MEDFIYLLGKVEPLIRKRDTKMRRAISARQQLSVTLQFLATGESFRCLRFQHRIGRTTIMKTCEALYDVLKEDYLKGTVSDAGLFGQSDLRTAMDRDLLDVPCPEPLQDTIINMLYVFIGDKAFPLRTDLVKPYPYQNQDHGQQIFNYHLSRERCTVENAFGILANRCAFLTNVALEPDKVTTITLAALTIDNFLRDKASEAYLPPAYVDMEDENHRIILGAWRRDGELASVAASRAWNATTTAKEQRDQLKAYLLSPAGSVPWQENMI
ncbi:uncharacterized protein LOC121905356 isoform X1 [Thunnus maccoyii]|uniref:uncharacterized protein LOC121905356 isoform X1 n=1 Tax=Thunnus maccoyii TaxID=8240 RepID=UPI001C4D26C7|nr:uncharacterized protein LOC121905356 isoform X1 [Thunnus maccoyii]